MLKFVPLLSAAIALSGCGTLVKDRSQVPLTPVGGFGSAMGSPKTTPPVGRTPQNWNNADVITLDLPGLIERYAGRDGTSGSLEQALVAFDRSDSTTRGERRNSVVAAVFMASDKNCDVYLEYLHGNQITIKASSSIAATLFSGAGAIATPANSARILSALGSASTGVGGNLNDAIFSSKTVDVIAGGIRADRAELRNKIEVRMLDATTPYGAWPLANALADAFVYHGRCNALSGLSYLQGKSEKAKDTAETVRALPAAEKTKVLSDAAKAAASN